jgi:ABC-2 type transport system ATP-binding protein/lipopolysaccharide transport system ATP-binding protein
MRRERAFSVEIEYELADAVPGFDIALVVANRRGTRVLDELLSDHAPDGRGRAGRFVARVPVPPVLNAGDYDVGLWFGTAYEQFLWEPDLLRLRLEGGAADRPDRTVCLDLPWAVENVA